MRQLKIVKSITNRDSASLDKYFQDIGKEEMISAEEEVELARRIKKGDQKALEKLTKANLRFVVSVAKQYQNQGLTLSDLISEGNVGLIKAARRFDETKGFKFISYAVWWIRQSILQALAEQARLIRLPLNQVSIVSKIKRIMSEFEDNNERKPSIAEIAEIAEVPKYKIIDALRMSKQHVSVEAPLSENAEGTLLDVLENKNISEIDKKLWTESLEQEISRALSTLTQRESYVLRLFYGIGFSEMSLEEIGEHLDLTRERVRQIKEKAIRRLRYSSRSKRLKSFLG